MTHNISDHPQVLLAEAIAREAHADQVDKLQAEYIEHPKRVAESLSDPIARSAAWLHDVLEDTTITAHDLAQRGVAPDVIDVVHLMTRRDEVSDGDYYAAIRRHPIARQVKLADIADNTLEWRTAALDPAMRERLAAKYAHARQALGA